MKKLKVIDLLNMISRGEEVPKKIIFFNEMFIFNEDNCNFLYKYQKGKCQLFACCSLNDEVEIIEENKEEKKIPEKITMCTSGIMGFDGVENITTELKDKINEIIDYLESKEKGE